MPNAPESDEEKAKERKVEQGQGKSLKERLDLLMLPKPAKSLPKGVGFNQSLNKLGKPLAGRPGPPLQDGETRDGINSLNHVTTI